MDRANASPAPPIAAGEKSPLARSARFTALIVACALFMQQLDSTVVATALPAMAKAFGADPVHMNVALTSYLISLAVFIPASGWIADRYGAKPVFRAAIVVFTIGSVLCGRADTLGFLVASRILQGVGGAMMVPVGRLLLLRSVRKSELVAAMAWLSMPAMVGPVVGPPLGGFLVTYLSWRWIFDINVPIGLIGVLLVTRYIKDVREPVQTRLDGIGLVLSAVAAACTMFGLETVGRGVVPPLQGGILLGTGGAAGLLYWLHARRHPAPLLDFTLMRIPTFMVSVVAGTLFRIGIGAIPFLLPLMLQIGFGHSAAESGMITFASSAGALVMKPAAMSALRRFGFRNTLAVNGVVSAVLLAACALFRPSWPMLAIYAALLLGGFFRSLQFTAYNTLAYADIPRSRMSAATSLYSTLQQVSMTLGVTVGAAALGFAMTASGVERPTVGDFSAAFVVVSLVSLLAAPLGLLISPAAGEELSGHALRARNGRGGAKPEAAEMLGTRPAEAD